MQLETKKQQAIKHMKQIGIYDEYIKEFEKNNYVCYFEYFGGYWAFQRPEVQAKMKELEEKYNCVVYAITHEFAEFGECYSFLFVSDHRQDWKYNVDPQGNNKFLVFAYVWNKDDDFCSEFGTIAIQSFGGGIRRIG